MSVPVAFRGVLDTVPGRVTLRVPVPRDVLGEAEGLAERLGVDRAVVLGDLVASAIPDALAEAADELVGAPARERLAAIPSPDAATPPALADGATGEISHDHADGIVPAAGPEPVAGDGRT